MPRDKGYNTERRRFTAQTPSVTPKSFKDQPQGGEKQKFRGTDTVKRIRTKGRP